VAADSPTPRVPLVYANTVNVAGTALDLSVDFGYGSSEEAAMAVRVVTTWEQAALLVGMLQEAIDRYGQDVGPIRDLKKLMPATDETGGEKNGRDT